MTPTTQTLFFMFALCALQEAAPPQLARCSGGLCVFQLSVDSRGAQESCSNYSGRLVGSSSEVQMQLLSSLLAEDSGRYWVRSGAANCAAALVRRGQFVEVVSVPCRDTLDGFACRYKTDEVCKVLNASAQGFYTINTSARFQVLGADSFPPGTVALLGLAQQPDSKHLCAGAWLSAPWGCEVMNGGCEHDCDPSASTCTCRGAHALHPNGFSCVRESSPQECEAGYEPAASGEEGCVDVDECEEHVCATERHECVNEPGGYRCVCAHGFAEEDGVCVDVSICLSCEQDCVQVNGLFRCSCVEGFTVVPEEPTKCRQTCSGPECRALCLHDPRLEERDMQPCSCPDGYIVDISNGTASCVDINECEHQEMCDHRCENTFGSYRCVCEDGFRLERGDRCVSVREDPPESPPLSPHPPESLQPHGVPAYIKTGSILGISLFLVLCVVLLGFLLQNMTRRCGRVDLTSLKSPDIFYLQQVSTETYKRLPDRQSVPDSLRL